MSDKEKSGHARGLRPYIFFELTQDYDPSIGKSQFDLICGFNKLKWDWFDTIWPTDIFRENNIFP